MAKKRKKPAFTFWPASPVRRRYSKDRRWLTIGNRFSGVRYRCDRFGVPILTRLLMRHAIKQAGGLKKWNRSIKRVENALKKHYGKLPPH